MVQLPYLQPFDDVNKRVSRLAANIPLIKGNLSPLSFADVPQQTYTEAMLGVYELNQVDLLKDVFIWAYERSASRYAAVRQSLGEPDPFRLRHRAALRALVGEVVRGRMDKKAATALCRRMGGRAHRGRRARAIPGDRRERAARPARGQLRALPDQAVRIRGVALPLGIPNVTHHKPTMLIEKIKREFVVDKSTLPDRLRAESASRGWHENECDALVAMLSIELSSSQCFLDKLTGIWRYEFGRPHTVDGSLMWGNHMWAPVSFLFNVLVCEPAWHPGC